MNAWLIRMRSVARLSGLTALLQALRWSKRYEERFRAALIDQIYSGDTVWDVGANVGLYSGQFLERVGPNGRVVAFEPVPACCEVLARRFADVKRMTIENVAMGEETGQGVIELNDDPLSPLNKVKVSASSGDNRVVHVTIVTGDEYARTSGHA